VAHAALAAPAAPVPRTTSMESSVRRMEPPAQRLGLPSAKPPSSQRQNQQQQPQQQDQQVPAMNPLQRAGGQVQLSTPPPGEPPPRAPSSGRSPDPSAVLGRTSNTGVQPESCATGSIPAASCPAAAGAAVGSEQEQQQQQQAPCTVLEGMQAPPAGQAVPPQQQHVGPGRGSSKAAAQHHLGPGSDAAGARHVLRGEPRRVGTGGTVWAGGVSCNISRGCCEGLASSSPESRKHCGSGFTLHTSIPCNRRDQLPLPLAGLGSDLQLHVSFVHSFIILSTTMCACCLCAQGCTPTQALQQLLQRVLPLPRRSQAARHSMCLQSSRQAQGQQQ
jgi:hypothetical protein